MLDDYIEYIRSINSEIYRNGVRLPINLDSDYAQVSRSVGILDDFLYFNRILSLCGSAYKIKSLPSGSEVLYSDVMKSEFFAEFMERRQNSRDSEQTIPIDPMAQHTEVQMLSSVLRNFENSEYSNSEEIPSSSSADDFMSRFVIAPVEFEGDDEGDNYEDYEEEEYPVDAQGNRVSEEEYIDSDDLEFDNYDDLDNEDSIYGDDLDSSDSPYEDDLDNEDGVYEDDLEFDNYYDEGQEGYSETVDMNDLGVSYEGIDEDDELSSDSLISPASDDALDFDSASDYEDSDSIADNYDFEDEEDDSYEEDVFGFDSIDEEDDISSDYEDDISSDYEDDISSDYDDDIFSEYEDDISSDYEDDSYEEDTFGFDSMNEEDDISADYEDDSYEEEGIPDEDPNYFDSYLDDDDEEYYGYDDFQRDTSREYEESEIFSSGSSVEPQTQIINNVQSTSTPSAQSRDSDEVLADALVDGLSKVLKFGKSRLKNSGLLDKDTK